MAHELPNYCIFESPLDFPGEFVARRWLVGCGYLVPDQELFARGPTLDSVRRQLPPGLYRLNRAASDDPCIVEIWL